MAGRLLLPGLRALDPRIAAGEDGSGNRGRSEKTFRFMVNAELGLHCAGLEFACGCGLSPYRSMLAEAVKAQHRSQGEGVFAKLLEAHPNVGKDRLNRQTVLPDADPDGGNTYGYV